MTCEVRTLPMLQAEQRRDYAEPGLHVDVAHRVERRSLQRTRHISQSSTVLACWATHSSSTPRRTHGPVLALVAGRLAAGGRVRLPPSVPLPRLCWSFCGGQCCRRRARRSARPANDLTPCCRLSPVIDSEPSGCQTCVRERARHAWGMKQEEGGWLPWRDIW